jgi:pilus assembly protein CpaB
MDRKKLLLLTAALVVAIGTALAARSMFADVGTPQARAAQVPAGPRVLVAQRTLPVGTIITADAIRFQPWPKDLVQDAYFLDGAADVGKLLGTVVRFPITAGQPVTKGALVAPGDRGFLAAALTPGMRAITVPVSAKTGVGGFIFPGDRVDVVLTQTIAGADDQSLKTSETIVRNLRVLATDQSTSTEVVDGKTVVKSVRTVTLEVTPKIAEKITVAQAIGTLSLSLRPLADSGAELDRAIAGGDVTVPDGLSKDQEDTFLHDAMNRPLDSRGSFVTGGDVSRFQRRTLPPRRSSGSAAAAPPPPSMAMSAPVPRGGAAVSVQVAPGAVVRVTRGKETVAVPVGRN